MGADRVSSEIDAAYQANIWEQAGQSKILRGVRECEVLHARWPAEALPTRRTGFASILLPDGYGHSALRGGAADLERDWHGVAGLNARRHANRYFKHSRDLTGRADRRAHRRGLATDRHGHRLQDRHRRRRHTI